MEPLSVAWHPGPKATSSPYIRSQAEFLGQAGVVVTRLGNRKCLNSDLVHVHWPEHLARGSTRTLRVLSPLYLAFVVALLQRPRAPALVWTIHNLEPHERAGSAVEQWLERRFFSYLAKRVDVVVILVDSQRSVVRNRFGFSAQTPLHHVPEGITHRPIPLPPSSSGPIKLASIGSISPYKGFVHLAEAFSSVPADVASLHIAGRPDSVDEVRLLTEHEAKGHIVFEPRRLSEGEMDFLLEDSHALIVAHHEQFNSGSPWTALGANRPVIIVDSELATDLQQAVGQDWVFILPADFGPKEIGHAIEWAGQPRAPLNATQFDWPVVTARLVNAYETAILRRKAKRYQAR